MAKIENFVDALEAYLAKQGKGGNYLANKLTSLFENKTSPLNLKDGPLKDFGDKLKDFNNNTKRLNDFSEKLTDKIKDLNKELKIKTFTSLDTSIKNLSNKISNISLPSFNNINFPSLSGFKKTLDSLLTRMRDFRDSIKIGVMNTFMNNIKNMNTLTRKINTILNNNNSNSKSTRGKNSVVDVNIVGIDSSIKSFLNNLIKKVGTTNNTLVNNTKDKEEGSIIGKIIKGIIGTVALLAGIGFLSKFLDTPMGKAIGNAFGNMKNAFIKMLKPFLEKLFDYSIEGLRAFFIDLPKYFLKQTFNFFGLKEKLGAENEGLAVILTKGIYYGLKKLFFGIANTFTLGGFSKLKNYLLKPFLSIGGQIGKLEKLGDIFYRLGSNVSAIPRYIKSLTKSSVVLKSAFYIMEKTFSALLYVPKLIWNFFSNMGFGVGKITKGIGAIAKIGGGSILKILGAGLKGIAKRIPFIGALISFKDAYERIQKGDITGGLISIGSGIATFFPGIGTAIAIGLDVLNAFLDRKTEGGKTSKLGAIGDMFAPLYNKIKDFVLGTVNFIINTFDYIKNWMTNKFNELKNYLYDKTYEKGYDVASKIYNPGYAPPTDKEIEAFKESQRKIKEQRSNLQPVKVGDARLSNNKVVIPSSDDDVVMAKRGGPFDEAFKEMNEKLDALISVFAQGTQLIANTTIQGSASVAQAVVASSGKSPVIVGGNDPIADFRLRANKSVG